MNRIKTHITALLLGFLLIGSTPAVFAEQSVQSASTTERVLIAQAVPPSDPKTDTSGIAQNDISPDLKKTLDTIVLLLSMVLKAMYALMVPILGLIGKFLSNDWVTGSFLNFDVVIELIWQFVRNLVNIIVVLYLIYVAGRNILPFGGKAENADIKQVLPKVALALVAVNFSLLFCRTVLTVSNVATTAAFSIPGTVGTNVLDEGSDSYSFFIWAQPIGAEDQKQVYSCPSGSTLQTTNGTNGTVIRNCIPTDGSSTITTPTTAESVSQEMYMMECLHKNYAFRAADPAKNNQASFFANPSMQAGQYVEGDKHYNRIFFTGSKTDHSAYNDELNKKKAEVRAQTGENPSHPYYNDCVTSFSSLAFSAQNAMYVYAFNLLKIGSYETSFANISSFSDLAVRVFTGSIFLFIFLIVNVALLVAVVGRAFLLWMMMALSPLWVLTEILKIWKGNQQAEPFLGGTARFINLAMMPAYVGIVLSLGFVMYHFLSYVGGVGEGIDSGRFQLGSITLYFNPDTALVGGIGNPFQLMFPLLALCALAIAVFAALKFGLGSKNFVLDAVQKVQDVGVGVGKYVGSMPFEAPIVPIPGKTGKFSLKTLASVPERYIDEKKNIRRNDERARLDELFGTDSFAQQRGVYAGAIKADNAANNKNLAALYTQNQQSNEFRAVNMKFLQKMYNETSRRFDTPNGDVTIEHNGQKYTLQKSHAQKVVSEFNGNVAKLGGFQAAYRDIQDERFNSYAVGQSMNDLKGALFIAGIEDGLKKAKTGGFTSGGKTLKTPQFDKIEPLLVKGGVADLSSSPTKIADITTALDELMKEMKKEKVEKLDLLEYFANLGKGTAVKTSDSGSTPFNIYDHLQKNY